MISEISKTLYDSVKEDVGHWESVVFSAVATSLASLGGDIYHLEWSKWSEGYGGRQRQAA